MPKSCHDVALDHTDEFPEVNRITPERLMGFTFGFAPPTIIETGLRLGIFDLLDEDGSSVDEMTASSGASARGLRIVLNALVGLDLLGEGSHGTLFADARECSLSGFWQTNAPWRWR